MFVSFYFSVSYFDSIFFSDTRFLTSSTRTVITVQTLDHKPCSCVKTVTTSLAWKMLFSSICSKIMLMHLRLKKNKYLRESVVFFKFLLLFH